MLFARSVKLLAAASLVGLTFSLTACAPDNVAACKEACGNVNALECTMDDFLNCDSQCPESWNETGLDYTSYIECVYGQYGCDDNGAYEFTSASCTLPS